MASAKVVLFRHNILKNGEHPIYLRIIKDRKSCYIKTGASCSKELWDDDLNLPKKKHPYYKELIVLIGKKKLDADKLLLGAEADTQDYSADEFSKKLRRPVQQRTQVIGYFNTVINRLEKSSRIGTANILKSTRNSLSKFIKGKDDFDFNEINNSFLTRYEEWFMARGVLPNSIFVMMRTLKTVINYAKKDEIVPTQYDPFKEFSFTKFRRIRTKKRALSKDQIQKIAAVELEAGSRLFHAKNYFLFSFYNRGINFVDMAHLKWTDIQDKHLKYSRKKTNEDFVIGMLEPSIEILNYYRMLNEGINSSFVFPILNEKYSTPKTIDNRLDRMLKLVNADLKEIGAMCGIPEKLTTYVARHSYATILKKSGIATAIISEALGHQSEKTTRIYLDSFENQVLDEASKVIL